MKKILIMAGGTATAWHITQIILKYFKEEFEISICDINEKELVPAAKYADFFYQVPYVQDSQYESHMWNLIKDKKFDILIPLIDWDLKLFSNDNINLKNDSIFSTAPCTDTFEKLSDKYQMYVFLEKIGVPVLKVLQRQDICNEKSYIIKPRIGFGARGVKKVIGIDIKWDDLSEEIVQECYDLDNGNYEITAEVYNFAGCLKVFQRQRIETKVGVCTKMKPILIPEINKAIERMVQQIECPIAMCIQFIYNGKEWCVSDCNLRLGAGTALATAAGFQLTRALLQTILDQQEHSELLEYDKEVKSILRVYDEVVIK